MIPAYDWHLLHITAIDLFEQSPMSDEEIRTNRNKYFEERWRYHRNHSAAGEDIGQDDDERMSIAKKNSVSNVLCTTLPTALSKLLSVDELFLFNEHYVVKPPDSNITFRWHRDADEQLQFCYDQNIEYYSLWCPLDDVDSRNGTLQVPEGTEIHTVDLSVDDFEWTPTAPAVEEVISTLPQSDDGGGSRGGSPSTSACPSSSLSIAAAPGSAVVFSSLLWHCSGPNLSASPRRVIYAQYSRRVITSTSGSHSGNDAPSGDETRASPSVKKMRIHPPRLPLSFAIPCICIGTPPDDGA